jgi:hypothetical protein
MTEGCAVDHVILGVDDLAGAADALGSQHGLTVLDGGRHPGWGTANRIVPLGDTYLELVTVADQDEAARSDFGRWVTAMLDGTAPPAGWVVRTDDIDAAAARLGLNVTGGERRGADGAVLRWRFAGVGVAAREPWLPFVIQWGRDAPHPGERAVQHPSGPLRLRELHVSGDEPAIRGWLGGSLPPQVRTTPGSSGPTHVLLVGGDGDRRVDLVPPVTPRAWPR